MAIEDNTTALQAVLDAINSMSDAEPGLDTSDATATADDILAGETAYVNGEKITGTIPTVAMATPSIMVLSTGVINATSVQQRGYVASGSRSASYRLATQSAKTVTPTTSDQVAVASEVYTTGDITVKGDANLIPENIAEGVSIFGVEGTHSGGSGGGNTVSITTEYFGVTAYYFDADGNQAQLGGYRSYDVIGGILFIPYAPYGVIVNSTVDYTMVNDRDALFICIKGDATVSIEEDL